MHCNCILPRHRAASNNSPPLGPKNWTCHRGCHRGWSDEIAARLYDENCFVCRSSPESLIQLDELIVENLIPEVNPLANAERISDANAARGTFCTIFNSALSDLLSTCRTGNLRCTFAIGKYRTSDGDFHESTLDLPTSRLQPRR